SIQHIDEGQPTDAGVATRFTQVACHQLECGARILLDPTEAFGGSVGRPVAGENTDSSKYHQQTKHQGNHQLDQAQPSGTRKRSHGLPTIGLHSSVTVLTCRLLALATMPVPAPASLLARLSSHCTEIVQ